MIEGDFDRLVDQAWPAPGRRESGSWVLRHAGGVTKRAESVLPLGVPGDLGAAVDDAERFYASLGRPCVFSMGAGATPGLDAELAARGYRVVDPTLVMTAVIGRGTPAGGDGVRLAAEPTAGWIDTWQSVDGRFGDESRKTAERIITAVPAVYASVSSASVSSSSSAVPSRRAPSAGDPSRGHSLEGDDAHDEPALRHSPAAVGRGVLQEGGWLGVYCMAVVPEARRRGHGRAVLGALLSFAEQQGAQRAYLVVTEANSAARSLYERAGFTVSSRYHYRVR
ncbi:GNAT family N-acetyltransferase [Microtetraspora sp. NBRC 13810]|uniref:GNAT family N-acetyltransferase n=1 Tax=Microtetraspora sp. NBRC 13810 TaxID=3030990 RepID=UPI002554C427|nr:GNAT family N-acetyltransferase [Microtetraspora sp. NBRC 13810]